MTLAGRLRACAERVDHGFYAKPATPEEAVFLMAWADALSRIAEVLVEESRGLPS